MMKGFSYIIDSLLWEWYTNCMMRCKDIDID